MVVPENWKKANVTLNFKGQKGPGNHRLSLVLGKLTEEVLMESATWGYSKVTWNFQQMNHCDCLLGWNDYGWGEEHCQDIFLSAAFYTVSHSILAQWHSASSTTSFLDCEEQVTCCQVGQPFGGNSASCGNGLTGISGCLAKADGKSYIWDVVTSMITRLEAGWLESSSVGGHMGILVYSELNTSDKCTLAATKIALTREVEGCDCTSYSVCETTFEVL